MTTQSAGIEQPTRDAVNALAAAMNDPDLRAEIDKAKSEFDPLPGERLQKTIADFAKAQPEMIARMQAYLRQ